MDTNQDLPYRISYSWLLPFGSVIVMLLAICIVLLSFSTLDQSKLAEASGSIKAAFLGYQPDPPHVKARLQEAMEFQEAVQLVLLDGMLKKNANDAKSLEVKVVDDGVLVLLSHEAIFTPGVLTIRAEVKPVLKQIATLLGKLSNKIRIEGHTSNQPPTVSHYPGNWVVSAVGAAMVADFFVTEGVDPARLMVRGMGQYAPLETNSTPEGRARNQRIEIFLTRDVLQPKAPPKPGANPTVMPSATPATAQVTTSITPPASSATKN
ncbi:MAG: flagellar motor protein MotB [Magnetococcus sp. YQC-5]